MSLVPWDEAMALGFGVLRLSPASFWAMTPRELAAAARALGGHGGRLAPSRGGLEALMARFPDRTAAGKEN